MEAILERELKLQQKATACSICADTRTKIVYRGCRCRRRELTEQFDLIRCLGCGVIFSSPSPSTELLSWLYSGEYQSHSVGGQPVRGLLRIMRSVCMVPYRLRFGKEGCEFSPFGQGRLLDIGCGTGEYIAAMTKRGWKCSGCDLSSQALTKARQTVPDARLYDGSIEDLPFQSNCFEAVSLWHTLEHLRDPLSALRRIHDLLMPGGRLVMAVPNSDSLEARILGKRWMEIDIPGHLFFFSRTTLSALIEKLGFRCERIRPQVHPSSVSESLGFFVDDLLAAKRARHRMPLYYGLFPFTVASYVLGNWGCIEVVARKN